MVCECSTGCNSYRINLRFGMMVLYAKSSLLILVMLPPVFRVLQDRKSYFCVDCDCSTGWNSYRIIFKFGIMVLNDESKKPIDFGDAAPSVLYCIVSEVILLCMVCEHCNCYRLIFKFAMKVHHDKAKKPIITYILGECYPLQIARCRRDRQWRYTCLTFLKRLQNIWRFRKRFPGHVLKGFIGVLLRFF